MERLTESDLNKVCYDPWKLCGMDGHCTRGCHEEGGCTKGCHILKMYKKLADYEDAEEQGLLIRMPCKVGDTVYEPRPDRGFISVYEITLITISGTNIFYKWMLVDGIYSNLDGFSNDKIGKTVFLTYEEAERKLKELQKDSVYNEQIS